MKWLVLLSAFIVLALIFLPIPLRGETGLYNIYSGLIYCQPSSCVHEVGHKMDDLGGWVSGSDEFKKVVSDMGLDLWNEKETYAEIFELADGKEENMPEQLREFYDWELAEKLLEKYTDE